MEYRAVGNRCAIDFDSLELPISYERAFSILTRKGFRIIEVELITLARQCVGKSLYRRGARFSEAPTVVDCSSLIKWLYGQRGIWLPRRSIQQRELGESIQIGDIIAGDVVFVSGRIDYYRVDPSTGVGHVGIATGNNGVIHAADKKAGVVENSLDKFVGKTKFRGVRRYIQKNRKIITLETPVGREIETADDIRWVVLQSL